MPCVELECVGINPGKGTGELHQRHSMVSYTPITVLVLGELAYDIPRAFWIF